MATWSNLGGEMSPPPRLIPVLTPSFRTLHAGLGLGAYVGPTLELDQGPPPTTLPVIYFTFCVVPLSL